MPARGPQPACRCGITRRVQAPHPACHRTRPRVTVAAASASTPFINIRLHLVELLARVLYSANVPSGLVGPAEGQGEQGGGGASRSRPGSRTGSEFNRSLGTFLFSHDHSRGLRGRSVRGGCPPSCATRHLLRRLSRPSDRHAIPLRFADHLLDAACNDTQPCTSSAGGQTVRDSIRAVVSVEKQSGLPQEQTCLYTY